MYSQYDVQSGIYISAMLNEHAFKHVKKKSTIVNPFKTKLYLESALLMTPHLKRS